MNYTARVISGEGRGGKLLDFPTLNLEIPQDFDYKHGIYAGLVEVEKQKYLGAFHFGPVPSFEQDKVSLEVFVLDTFFNQRPTRINFSLEMYLREIIKFDSFAALKKQISQDVIKTKEVLKAIMD